MHELTQKTLSYWNLSRCYSRRTSEVITTEKAFKVINLTLQALDPNRPLAKRLEEIRVDIIHGESPKRKDGVITQFPLRVSRTANPLVQDVSVAG